MALSLPGSHLCRALSQAALISILLAIAGGAGGADIPTAEQLLFFENRIRPVLTEHCYKCHSNQSKSVKGELKLDSREGWNKGGESGQPAIVPGDAKKSYLLKAIRHEDPAPAMPPKSKLSANQIADLTAWVKMGAPDPRGVATISNPAESTDWWSLKPLTRPVIPLLTGSNANGRVPERNPIDAFMRAKLSARGLAPAPEADRRTLIRRVYFDLIGLPPTPAEVDTFLADVNPQAYENLVDRLLSSPHYGERWARHWMDAAHFAETHGHDQDRIRENAWPFRDYLISSFNADKPYGKFIQEQVAGDALFPNDPRATAALGFLAAGPWDESSLRDIREDTLDRQIARYIDRDDMIATVMNNVTSTTVQCARCHDHKFDPISQRDYYALQAVFAGVERANRSYDADPGLQERRIELLSQKRLLESRDPETLAALLTPQAQSALAAWERTLPASRINWTVLQPEICKSTEGSTLTKQPDGSVLSGGKRPDRDTYIISANIPLATVSAIRLEVLTDNSLPHHGPGRQDNGNLHLSELQVFLGDESGKPVPLGSVSADFNQVDWGIEKAVDGNEQTAWGIYPKVGLAHQAILELKSSLISVDRQRITIVLKQRHGGGHLIGRLRLSVTDTAPPVSLSLLPEDIATILAVPPPSRSREQSLAVAVYHRKEAVQREITALPKPSMVYAAASDFEPDGGLKPPPGPRPIHILHRGDIQKPRDPAAPGALSCLVMLSAEFPKAKLGNESTRRAALAEWLTDQRNPLTWRSIVNRLWHHHFGKGLVTTLNDFGRMGALPSHPDLLDWLAVEFRDNGQSLKKLHRLLVTSSTYRQSSRATDVEPRIAATASAIDSDNQLLWRMNRTRMDAESIRDAVLMVSGRLDPRMGGPSDRQFDLKPGIHVTPRIDYSKFDLDGQAGRRRSVYRFLFRTLPDPFMETLDCPSGDQITPVRVNSVTVQQALAMWNDAFMARHCEHLAARVTKMGNTADAQVDALMRLLFGRGPNEAEATEMSSFAAKHGLTNLCRVLFNSNEFMFVN